MNLKGEALQGTTLILVRHGATAANVRRPSLLQGLFPDSELIDQGREQARAAAAALRRQSISAIYATPLKRACETARLIAEPHGISIAVEEALVEADFGAWTGLSWPEIEERWPDQVRAFRADCAQQGYPSGENLAQVRDRAVPAIERLVKLHEGKFLVVVAHGTVNRVLLAHWLGIPLREARTISQDNAAINTIEFVQGTAAVHAVNATTHLSKLLSNAA